MPRERLVPSTQELERMVAAGMTHAEIAAEVTQQTGVLVARATISSALSRAGKTRPMNRYKGTIPWRVRPEHSAHYAARMLRALGRASGGHTLGAAEQARLESWLGRLEDEHLIVAYCPDDLAGPGWHYIAERHKDHDDATPIRRKALPLSAIS